MPENQTGPEQQAMLPKAVSEVVLLYTGDQLSILLGTQGVEQRDEAWAHGAQEFPAFADKFIELRTAMKVITETKKAYPPAITNITRVPFVKLEDKVAQQFLGDILFSRMTESQGYIDYGLDMAEESQKMALEMGIKDGWRSGPAASVTLENSVGAVLTGALRVAHVPASK